MSGLQRGVPVLAAMTVATSLSSAVALTPGWGLDGYGNTLGALFACAVFIALLASKRWHRVHVQMTMVLPAILVVSLSFPALLWGGAVMGAGAARLFGTKAWGVVVMPAMTLTSAIGARVVAAGMRWVTGRRDRLLCWAMVAWGAVWPGLNLLFPQQLQLLRFESVLAWHVPIGLACAAWFLRSTTRDDGWNRSPPSRV